MTTKKIEHDVRACYSTWASDYYDKFYGKEAPYPPVHRDIIRELLRKSHSNVILDAGCGPASFLRELSTDEFERFGFDLTPEMVSEAKRIFEIDKDDPTHIWEGSVLSPSAYSCPTEADVSFDAVVCIGVLPHIPSDQESLVFQNLVKAVKPGGLCIVEGRNQLFSLFTSNCYSSEFILDELIRKQDLMNSIEDPEIERALENEFSKYSALFRMDQPPKRTGDDESPGYDEILSRTHNPLLVKEQLEQIGLKDVQILFYHFHCLPPLFESASPSFFRQRSLEMENPQDWRGYFMASAFLIMGYTP